LPTETTSRIIENAVTLRQRLSHQLQETRKIVERSREALAQLDDIYRQLTTVRRD
jgi:hypothetical protein